MATPTTQQGPCGGGVDHADAEDLEIIDIMKTIEALAKEQQKATDDLAKQQKETDDEITKEETDLVNDKKRTRDEDTQLFDDDDTVPWTMEDDVEMLVRAMR